MGFPVSLTKADKDFFALWIAGSHFGEHRQKVSHLFQKIREERGQNYGDYAYIEHFVQGRDKFPAPNHAREQQYFSIWIRPLANSNRHFVIRQALRELKKFVDEGISEERFQLVRTYLLNYTKLYAQTLGERLGWQMDSHYYGRQDFLAEAQSVLLKLTREDVNRAIKKYLNFDNVCVAVITQDADTLKNDLVANTPSPVKYANPNMPKNVLDEDVVIQEFPLDVKAEKVRIALAAEFFQKAGLPAK
jgi:zinc protease